MLYLKNSYSKNSEPILTKAMNHPDIDGRLVISYWQDFVQSSSQRLNPKALILEDEQGGLGLLAHFWGFDVVRLNSDGSEHWPTDFPDELRELQFDLILSNDKRYTFRKSQHFFLERLYVGGCVLLLGNRSLRSWRFPGKPGIAKDMKSFGYFAGSGICKKKPERCKSIDRLLLQWWMPPQLGRYTAVVLKKQKVITR